MSEYELPISFNYVKDMDTQSALREIVQNAKDQELVLPNNKMEIRYIEEDKKLLISNKESILEINTLILGESTKQEDSETIGKFGEGYKLALLILTRENKPVTIYNYGLREVWKASERKSRKWKGNILLIKTSKARIWETVPDNNLTFEIDNVSKEDYSKFVENTLDLKDANIKKTSMGDILLNEDERGRIYVNGLYITTRDKFNYGYNILPKHLNIGRDRNLVDGFALAGITSQMILEAFDFDKAISLYKDDEASDMSGITNALYLKGLDYSNDNDGTVSKSYNSVNDLNMKFVKAYYKEIEETNRGKDFIVLSIYDSFKYEDLDSIVVVRVSIELYNEIKDLPEYIKHYNDVMLRIVRKKEVNVDELYENFKKKVKYKLSDIEVQELDNIINMYKGGTV